MFDHSCAKRYACTDYPGSFVHSPSFRNRIRDGSETRDGPPPFGWPSARAAVKPGANGRRGPNAPGGAKWLPGVDNRVMTAMTGSNPRANAILDAIRSHPQLPGLAANIGRIVAIADSENE